MKRFLLVLFLVAMSSNMAWAVSTNTWATNDAGFNDPRIYGGAADTMKQTETPTNTDDGSPVAHTLTVTAGYIEVDCEDSGTCDITMTETGAVEGDACVIVNIGTYAVDFADQGGILNVSSGSMAVGTDDTLTLKYTGALWVETARSNN